MKYTVLLEREADGGYVASVPVLPGCVSQGDTKQEVMANILTAWNSMLRTASQLVILCLMRIPSSFLSLRSVHEGADGSFRA